MYEQYDQKNELEPVSEKDWEKLSDFKCPLCSLPLEQNLVYSTCTCGFKIHNDRLTQLQTEQQNRRLNSTHRKALQQGKKIKFQQAKTFKGERPKGLGINF